MYITLETDYAIRIVDCLAREKGRLGAQAIANATNVPLRFSLKILCKLVSSGIVRSYKGAQGGYEIARPLEEININDILETIEGPYAFSRCLKEENVCTRDAKGWCPYHYLFQHISEQVRIQLQRVTMANILENDAG